MDKIKVATDGSWRFLWNGDETVASGNENGGDNLQIQTEGGPWVLTVNGAEVASSAGGESIVPPEPEPEPGPETGLPKMPSELVDRALAFPLPKYGNEGNASSNYGTKGTALLTTIYAWNGGDKRPEVRDNIEAILAALVGSNGPCGMNGPGAAQEGLALAWFHLYRASDLWDATDAATQRRIAAIFGALALIRAWEGNDGSASGGEWTITGGRDLDYKDVSPNISYSIPGQIVLIGEWFGYDKLEAWLEATSIAEVRQEVKEAFGGTGGRLYRTLNWRNEGISASEADAYYRSGPSDDTPTDSQINAALPHLRYYEAPISDLPAFLFPKDNRGLNKVMPPARYTQGSNEYVGVNQHTCNGGAGLTVDGKKRGYCLGDVSKMPHYPGEGAMPYELNGTDEGGIRSAMGYAWWTVFLANAHFVSMATTGNNGMLADSRFVDFLARWRQAYDIMSFFDREDYNSIAHAKTKKNGGPGPIVWSEGRNDWEPEINFFLWDTILKVGETTNG